jgi:hypothetical protein
MKKTPGDFVTVSQMCECGDPFEWHGVSGLTSGDRPCWGWKGQSTPRDWHLCECPGFRPIILMFGTAEGTPTNSWNPLTFNQQRR